MTDRRKAETLFLVNYALLATHEIDSAYWHEWSMFGLPGGVQLFPVLNLALLLLFATGSSDSCKAPGPECGFPWAWQPRALWRSLFISATQGRIDNTRAYLRDLSMQ